MPLWHCPHCGTPQPEAARCWVCRKSSTSCATCRHFRRGVAGQLGYCGLDRRREPLSGDEIRACWEATATALIGIGARTSGALTSTRVPLAWREVAGPTAPPGPTCPRPAEAAVPAEPDDSPANDISWMEPAPGSLWGELEA
jgi:hypothetical protein